MPLAWADERILAAALYNLLVVDLQRELAAHDIKALLRELMHVRRGAATVRWGEPL
jgi:hypothetical protein